MPDSVTEPPNDSRKLTAEEWNATGAEGYDAVAGKFRDEPHNAIPLYARGTHWINCTCGWVSATYRAQVGAVIEHAEHLRHAKAQR